MWAQPLCISWWEFSLRLSQRPLLPRWSALAQGHHLPGMLTSSRERGQCRLLTAWGGASVLTGWLWGFPRSVTLCNLWELLSAPWEVPEVLCGLPGVVTVVRVGTSIHWLSSVCFLGWWAGRRMLGCFGDGRGVSATSSHSAFVQRRARHRSSKCTQPCTRTQGRGSWSTGRVATGRASRAVHIPHSHT